MLYMHNINKGEIGYLFVIPKPENLKNATPNS